jgi:hypothetical protein
MLTAKLQWALILLSQVTGVIDVTLFYRYITLAGFRILTFAYSKNIL